MTSPARNDPCPCGSGRRHKHCCGAATRPDAGAAGPPAIGASPVEREAPVLSVVLPFYRKLLEFRRVLPENARWLAREGLEVVVAMDEPSEEAGLLELVRGYPCIRWTILVNDVPHPWRPPCRAINVGLRHARGRYVLVASPESAFAGDAPRRALEAVADFPGGIATGRVAFARFRDVPFGRTYAEHFEAIAGAPATSILSYYGSICAPRAAFEAIGGYDESFADWGGDDDDLRIRLEMAGSTLLACDAVRLLHLSFDDRRGGDNPRHAVDPAKRFAKLAPASVVANAGARWGEDFGRVAYESREVDAAARSASPLTGEPPAEPPTRGSVVPVPSRRACLACGRLVHYDPPRGACPACAPAAPAVRTRAAPRIACVMQLRNEAYWLPGCLDHLRGHVDAIVALDDGSTDATASLLAREPAVADVLSNPASAGHVWRERDNKRRLVERTRALGFDWVLCCDADERYESAFLANLRGIASTVRPGGVVSIVVALKELWDSPRHYRQDGAWGAKTRARFFQVPARVAYDLDSDLHGQWYPDHLRKYGRHVPMDLRLYHLKSIRREDRIRRRDFYNAIDPQRRFQRAGYDYLADEPADRVVEPIEAGREYDYATLPEDLRG